MKKYLLMAYLLLTPVLGQADDMEIFQKPSVSLASFVLSNIINMVLESLDHESRNQISEALSLAGGQKAAVAEYFLNEGHCPDNTVFNKGLIGKPSMLAGKYVEQVVVKEQNNHCTITAIMKTDSVNQELAGKTLTLTMTPLESVLMWECASNIGNQYLPAACQQ